MKRMGACLLLGTALALVYQDTAGSPPEAQTPLPSEVTIRARGTLTFLVPFESEEKANVIVVGEGNTILGLYVFDGDGNCVARDDRALGKVLDDCAVIWYPRRKQTYRIEVRNYGYSDNKAEICFR